MLGPWSCGSCIVVARGRIRGRRAHGSHSRSRALPYCARRRPSIGSRPSCDDLGDALEAAAPAALRVGRRAAQSRSARALARRVRSDDPRRLRTNRELAAGRQPARNGRAAGLDGQADAGTRRRASSTRTAKLCEPGEVGDIALRGDPPTLFTGLSTRIGRDERVAARGEWYLTGDRAQLDDDGYFWFVGRSDDVISSGAYRIGPFEVESALLEHPAVAESAVVGSPDPDRGNIVKAFVVLRPGYERASADSCAELQEHCKRVTAPYKYPREIEFIAELPKTRSGKIRRVELRQAELPRRAPPPPAGSCEHARDRLARDRRPAEAASRGVETPIAGTGEILIKVNFAAFNRRDVFITQGLYPGIVFPVSFRVRTAAALSPRTVPARADRAGHERRHQPDLRLGRQSATWRRTPRCSACRITARLPNSSACRPRTCIRNRRD